jgi:hypothetical protein
MSADEIIAKHIQSIANKDKLDSVTSRIAAGVSEFESKLPSKKTTGKAIIVGEGKNLMFVASFASTEYPFEKIGYFSGKQSLPLIPGGSRSPLGSFIAEHPSMLEEGLFGGVIALNWAPFNIKPDSSKIKLEGSKKVSGRDCYVLNYFSGSSGSSNFSIRLFFDKETFSHLRTEYRHVIPPQSVPSGILGTQTGLEQKVVEEFDDLRSEDGLTLPHRYKISYLTSSNSGTYEWIWGINITQYVFNQKLAENFFTFNEK